MLEILTCDPLIYGKDNPGFIVCSFMENVIGLKRVNRYSHTGSLGLSSLDT